MIKYWVGVYTHTPYGYIPLPPKGGLAWLLEEEDQLEEDVL